MRSRRQYSSSSSGASPESHAEQKSQPEGHGLWNSTCHLHAFCEMMTRGRGARLRWGVGREWLAHGAPRTDGVACAFAGSTWGSGSWHRTRVLQDMGTGGHRVKGSPRFDPKGKREAGCLRGSEENAEAGKAGGPGDGIRHSSPPAELGPQEPGVWCPLENLGPDWGGEQGGQPSGGGLRWGRNTEDAAGGVGKLRLHPSHPGSTAQPGLGPFPHTPRVPQSHSATCFVTLSQSLGISGPYHPP